MCADIIKHYEDNRQEILTGKALIVAYSRPIALSIYRKILELRPAWTEKIGVVMSSTNQDPEEWRAIIGNKRRRDEMAKKFKDNEDPLKIAIVVDMWLTGFDVPSLATMYFYKPMSGHNLMQAIARVNRVYEDKEGGLAVDYVGIAAALKQAMNDYTNRDKHNYGDMDIGKTALPKFVEKLEVCRNLMHGFDYAAFMTTQSDLVRAKLIAGGVNFLSAVQPSAAGAVQEQVAWQDLKVAESNEEYAETPRTPFITATNVTRFGRRGGYHPPTDGVKTGRMISAPTSEAIHIRSNDRAGAPDSNAPAPGKKDLFIKEALLLRQALTLCRSLLNAGQRLEAAYFEAVRTILTRLTGEGKPLSLKEINARINELLKSSIKSEGVINLFSDVDTGFSLFDPKFLEEIAKMKERNLSVEILRKLLAEQVSVYRRTNLVKSEKFSERLARVMKAYVNGMISNEEVIAELLKIAKDMAGAHADGASLGLSDEELAFYDALTRPEAVKDFYKNDELVAMTRELADTLRRNRTIDWQKKESARAGMRRLVRKLLGKYKYPPEGMEDAIATVFKQCEMWADN